MVVCICSLTPLAATQSQLTRTMSRSRGKSLRYSTANSGRETVHLASRISHHDVPVEPAASTNRLGWTLSLTTATLVVLCFLTFAASMRSLCAREMRYQHNNLLRGGHQADCLVSRSVDRIETELFRLIMCCLLTVLFLLTDSRFQNENSTSGFLTQPFTNYQSWRGNLISEIM